GAVMATMTADDVKAHFQDPRSVAHYEKAVAEIGLWRSEEVVLRRTFRPEETLLEVGCGTGRIAFGLWELGYRGLIGTDFSRSMIAAARQLAAKLEYAVPFRVTDARRLPFAD